MKWEEASSSGYRRWSPFVLIAMLVHLGLVWTVLEFDWLAPPSRSDTPSVKRVKLRNFSKPKVLAENPDQKRLKDERSEKLDEALQVVNLPPDHRSKPPKDAKFSATTDHSVEKETISRFQTPGYENAGHELTKSSPSPQEAPELMPPKEAKDGNTDPSQPSELASKDSSQAEPHTERPRPQEAKENSVKIDLGPPLKSFGNFAPKPAVVERADNASNQGSGPDRRRSIDRLIPDFRVLADLDSSPANDVMDDDIELGDGTYLNTKSFKYASFFNRFHRSVSQHWNPITEYRRRDPTGHVYGPRSRYTVLEVELNADGALIASRVLRSSGLDFLDREAIASLKRAAPFPNPPAALLDDDRIFFSFGFQVKYGRR